MSGVDRVGLFTLSFDSFISLGEKDMSFANVKDDGLVLVVNTDTGEVVSQVRLKEKKKIPLPDVFTHRSKYVGEETKYPSECMAEGEYLEVIKQLDGIVGNRVNVNTDMIVDAVSEGMLNRNDVKIIKFLASKVAAHNRAFTSLKEIEEGTGVKSSHLSRWFSENKGLCKVLQNRNGFVVEINPALVYKGSEEWRSYSITKWCSQVPYIK